MIVSVVRGSMGLLTLCNQSKRQTAIWLQRRSVATKKDDVVKHLKKAKLIPDVLRDTFRPRVQLSARFLSSGEECSFGNALTPLDAQGQPQVDIVPFPGEDAIPKDLLGAKAYVVMTDPDAPSRDNPESAEYCHWIAETKLPTSKDGGEIVHNRDAHAQIIEYAPPAPPEGTAKHRYLLTLLTGGEAGKEGLPKSNHGEDRKKWGNEKGRQRVGLQRWAEKNSLEVVAANYFVSEYDKNALTVEKLYDEKQGAGKAGSEPGSGASGSGYGG